ncbi:zinc-dependent alcohol dehydrogenase [Saccharopolyspora sp. 5N708]|uniref:zinc-dependent alcohol dehydrogenase n=1 Tax=Saccharopolyspora sp. 5N708 TaxID=3457424 RepID=UPI003FD3BBA2
MRALVFHGPGSIAVEQRPDPAPGPGEVLLEIIATGICGSDVHGFTGENGRRHPNQVMGHETVARVRGGEPSAGTSVGDVVTVNPVIGCGHCPTCAAGEEQACPQRRVIGVDPTISSAFADLMVVPTRNVVPLPAGVPEEHGALVEPLAVGFHAARRGRCSGADAVLVLGGGPIGQACVLAARRLGAQRIVVSEPDPQRAALVAALGARLVTPSTVGTEAERLLGGKPTLVLDAVGATATLAVALEVAARAARIVLVGMSEPSVTLPAYEISTSERELIGAFCYNREDFASTAAWIAEAGAQLDQLINSRVGWSGAPGAFRDLAAGTAQASKILVVPANP